MAATLRAARAWQRNVRAKKAGQRLTRPPLPPGAFNCHRRHPRLAVCGSAQPRRAAAPPLALDNRAGAAPGAVAGASTASSSAPEEGRSKADEEEEGQEEDPCVVLAAQEVRAARQSRQHSLASAGSLGSANSAGTLPAAAAAARAASGGGAQGGGGGGPFAAAAGTAIERGRMSSSSGQAHLALRTMSSLPARSRLFAGAARFAESGTTDSRRAQCCHWPVCAACVGCVQRRRACASCRRLATPCTPWWRGASWTWQRWAACRRRPPEAAGHGRRSSRRALVPRQYLAALRPRTGDRVAFGCV